MSYPPNPSPGQYPTGQQGQYPTGQQHQQGRYPQGQYPPTQAYPPGQIPPGQIPPYGVGPAPGSGGGGGGGTNIPLVIAVAVVGLIVIGVAGYFLLRPHHKNDNNNAIGSSTSSVVETTTETTTPDTETTTPEPLNVWIAVTYNDTTKQVVWAKSPLGSVAATARADGNCGAACKPAISIENGCVAVAVGHNDDGWASSTGNTATEALNAAINAAQNDYQVVGPYKTWSKCAADN